MLKTTAMRTWNLIQCISFTDNSKYHICTYRYCEKQSDDDDDDDDSDYNDGERIVIEALLTV